MTAQVAGSAEKYGYEDPRTEAVPVHGGVQQATPPPTGGGRQLNANTTPDWNNGPAAAIVGRVGNMVKGATEGRGAGSGMPGGMEIPGAGGGAAEGAAGEAAGVGELAELAPLAAL